MAAGEAGVVEDEGRDVLLVEQRAGRHISEKESIQVGGGELRVDQRLQPGFDADLPERPVPELAELRLADAEHRHLAHRYSPPMWILPRNFAYIAYGISMPASRYSCTGRPNER